MHIVIDTNQPLASFSKRSKTHWLWQAFCQRKYTLCVSTEILSEYAEIFEQKYSFEAAEILMEVLLESPNVRFITEYYHWGLIKIDPDDNKFVDCGLMANAEYIVTEDRHFRVLKKVKFPPIKVISTEEFKTLLLL